MRSVLLILFATSLALAETATPTLFYTKEFKGSVPPYINIQLNRDGSAIYKEDPKDEQPLTFKLASADSDQMFLLADKLDHFSRPLESNLKVAFMGAKTLRFEGDAAPHEAKFNYSEDADARLLVDWFEKIAETERGFIELERCIKFDKLGVQNAILRIEITRDQKRLIAPDQFLPMLDRIVKNESFLHLSRDRAAALAESIRAEHK